MVLYFKVSKSKFTYKKVILKKGLTTQIIASLYDISEDPSKPRTFKERICFWAPIKQSYIDKAFGYSIESGSGSRKEPFAPSCLNTDVETNTTPPENGIFQFYCKAAIKLDYFDFIKWQ